MRLHSESRFRLRIPKTRMAILPDVLRPNLKVVFCGTAAGDKSARAGAYYAGPQNKFWDILHRVRLTPRRLLPQEFEKLLDYGIGLTDLIKTRCGADNKLIFSEKDKEEFQAKINRLPLAYWPLTENEPRRNTLAGRSITDDRRSLSERPSSSCCLLPQPPPEDSGRKNIGNNWAK